MVRKKTASAEKPPSKERIKHSLDMSPEEDRLLAWLKLRAEAEALDNNKEKNLKITIGVILRAGLRVLKPMTGKQILKIVESLEESENRES
jgi:hypothetical protein